MGPPDWLQRVWHLVAVHVHPTPLSFARAVNRGIAAARYSHICLLNNDMIIEPGFFTALMRAFQQVPDLFSATAQIFFPKGVRREERARRSMRNQPRTTFPSAATSQFPAKI